MTIPASSGCGQRSGCSGRTSVTLAGPCRVFPDTAFRAHILVDYVPVHQRESP